MPLRVLSLPKRRPIAETVALWTIFAVFYALASYCAGRAFAVVPPVHRIIWTDPVPSELPVCEEGEGCEDQD